jgi:hypothetical protein
LCSLCSALSPLAMRLTHRSPKLCARTSLSTLETPSLSVAQQARSTAGVMWVSLPAFPSLRWKLPNFLKAGCSLRTNRKNSPLG